jgi:nitrous oxide reductase
MALNIFFNKTHSSSDGLTNTRIYILASEYTSPMSLYTHLTHKHASANYHEYEERYAYVLDDKSDRL